MTLMLSFVVNVSSEEYICTDPTDENGTSLPSGNVDDMKYLRITHRIDILPNNSFACYELLEVSY